MNKEVLLYDLQVENWKVQALLAEIGEERMDVPGVAGNWSVKDILIHISGWRRWTVMRLQGALRGEPDIPPPWPMYLKTPDEINAWIYHRGHSLTAAEALEEYQYLFQQLVDAIAAFPEEDLFRPGRFPWLDGKPLTAALFFAHFHEEHEADIRSWLEEQKMKE